jgi:hypothetical protein
MKVSHGDTAMNDISDRRKFWRAAFKAEASLVDADGVAMPAELLDISLKGALLSVSPQWQGRIGASYRINLKLADDADIVMHAVVTHVQGRDVGLRCEDIDLDSMTHLRRLVELNAGDASLLDRELAALLAAPPAA